MGNILTRVKNLTGRSYPWRRHPVTRRNEREARIRRRERRGPVAVKRRAVKNWSGTPGSSPLTFALARRRPLTLVIQHRRCS